MPILRIALIVTLATPIFGFSQNDAKDAGELIQVRAIVTDRQGKPVNDLEAGNFLLKEDDAQQALVLFSAGKTEDRPVVLSTPKGESTPGMSKSASGSSPGPTSSRSLVLLVDSPSISHSGMESVKTALNHFVEAQVADEDLVALMTTAGKPGVKGEFTKSRVRLQEGIKKLRPGRMETDTFLTPALCGKVGRKEPRAVTLAGQIVESEERTTGSLVTAGSNPEIEAASKCLMMLLEAASRRRAVISAIRAASDRLAAMPGQRVIALFSEGFSMIAPGGEVAFTDVRSAMSSAAHDGVMIYAFDARVALATKQINIGSLHLSSEMNDAVRDFQHGVALLASQTGGEAFFNIDGLSDYLQKMLDNNQVYYRLEYSPPANKDPRKYRNISVSVKNHPEYRVRATKGYAMADLPRSK